MGHPWRPRSSQSSRGEWRYESFQARSEVMKSPSQPFLRDDTKNGCEGDYRSSGRHKTKLRADKSYVELASK